MVCIINSITTDHYLMNTLQKSEFMSSPECYVLICLFCYEIPCITSYSLSYFNRHVVSYFKSTLFIDVNRIVEFSPNLNFIKSMGSWKLSSFEVKTSFINKFKRYHWKSRNWASTITNWQQFTHLKERIFSAKKAINKRSPLSF